MKLIADQQASSQIVVSYGSSFGKNMASLLSGLALYRGHQRHLLAFFALALPFTAPAGGAAGATSFFKVALTSSHFGFLVAS